MKQKQSDLKNSSNYVSPANSWRNFLSRIVFPNIEKEVKTIVKQIGIILFYRKFYKGNTSLLPQNVSQTKNAYYATMTILIKKTLKILFLPLFVYGKMAFNKF